MAMAIGALLTASCSDDDGSTTFPSMWNEIVCLTTDGQGRINRLLTDEGKSYMVTNNITGRTPNVAYRMMCGYTISGLGSGLVNMISTALRQCVVLLPCVLLLGWLSGIRVIWFAFWVAEAAALAFALYQLRRRMAALPEG